MVAGYAQLVRTEEVVLAFFQVQVIQVVQEPGRWCSVRCRWDRRRSPQESNNVGVSDGLYPPLSM